MSVSLDRFVLDRLGVAALARTADMLRLVEEKANEVADRARSIAPQDSGDYVDGIEVESGIENDVATGRVNANDWKSGLIEFGTDHTPAYAPLRKGAEAAGLSPTAATS